MSPFPFRHAGLIGVLAFSVLLLPGCRQAPVDADAAAAVASAEAATDPRVADYLLIRKEAEAGDAHARVLLAEKLLAGDGVEANPAEAVAWLEKAAERDFPPALDLLGALYYRGVGVSNDFRRARSLMERAVEHSYLPSLNNLAWFLSTCPDDSLRDGKRAIALLTPVLDQSPQMLDTLAAAYAETGDFDHAIELQQQAIGALESGRVDRHFGSFLQRLERYSRGVPWRDPPPAR